LLGLARSTYYHVPQPESAENLRLMRKIDELYLKYPFFGSRKMAVELGINRKRAQRLMRLMGIEAHYAKPHLSRPAPGHQVYPYLLRNVTSIRHNAKSQWPSRAVVELGLRSW
jgi:putative transposase